MRAWVPGSAVAGTLPSATIARRPPAARSRSPSACLRAALWRTGSGWVGKPERPAAGVARLCRRRGRLGSARQPRLPGAAGVKRPRSRRDRCRRGAG